MKVESIKPHVGARIYVDKSSLCDPEVVASCLEMLEDRAVVVFPRIGLSDQEQLAFTNRLGMQGHGTRNFPGANLVAKDVFELSLRPENKSQAEYVKTSYFWHIDGVTSDDPWPKGTLLFARRIAPKGGQTEFANTFAAYDELPAEEKADIADLKALHTALAAMRWVLESPSDREKERLTTAFPAKAHPIVWTHGSGRKSLKIGISADHVIGMPVADGRALLARLLEWAAQREFTYRHDWEVGDLVVWNNHAVLHRAIPYDPDSGRAMRRTSFETAQAN